jgi:hypothetical protein
MATTYPYFQIEPAKLGLSDPVVALLAVLRSLAVLVPLAVAQLARLAQLGEALKPIRAALSNKLASLLKLRYCLWGNNAYTAARELLSTIKLVLFQQAIISKEFYFYGFLVPLILPRWQPESI